jgi:hypothetical protein
LSVLQRICADWFKNNARDGAQFPEGMLIAQQGRKAVKGFALT